MEYIEKLAIERINYEDSRNENKIKACDFCLELFDATELSKECACKECKDYIEKYEQENMINEFIDKRIK